VGPFHSWALANRFYSQEVDYPIFALLVDYRPVAVLREKESPLPTCDYCRIAKKFVLQEHPFSELARVVCEYRALRLRLSNFLRPASGPPRPLGEQCFLHPLCQELDGLFSLSENCHTGIWHICQHHNIISYQNWMDFSPCPETQTSVNLQLNHIAYYREIRKAEVRNTETNWLEPPNFPISTPESLITFSGSCPPSFLSYYRSLRVSIPHSSYSINHNVHIAHQQISHLPNSSLQY